MLLIKHADNVFAKLFSLNVATFIINHSLYRSPEDHAGVDDKLL
uniref:Uncharacterized protein n=1 Tax=Lepeophtheirus salmonis TaxID=72036 RepID=A0A0K2UY45_LEPSM